jgi:hypothetical protein
MDKNGFRSIVPAVSKCSMLANPDIINRRGTIIYISIESRWLLWLMLETGPYGRLCLRKT